MAYYMMLNYDVTDKDQYQEYAKAARPTLLQHGAEILAVDHSQNDIEGASRHTIVLLRFESEEAAMSWYNSAEYAEIIKMRTGSTEGWLRGVPSFDMPVS